jgi:hypothetical protein
MGVMGFFHYHVKYSEFLPDMAKETVAEFLLANTRNDPAPWCTLPVQQILDYTGKVRKVKHWVVACDQAPHKAMYQVGMHSRNQSVSNSVS